MNKVERNGKVAVLVSPGFGAGWSTWNNRKFRDTLLMDADIVEAVLSGDFTTACEIARLKCDESFYGGGANSLEVEWVEKGQCFEVEEYDGSERLHIIGNRDYPVA